ncbi:SusC/RagA family TonB-linked outer membrane protein [Bacteroidia bacterium]|nr:SusC/RagA family TonB-linked outer membrane protein [Bacteroidia bacterium]GHT67903.1 SusC/RagA family TonB-linked outer membrane protein [Bacteroidia bacterium]
MNPLTKKRTFGIILFLIVGCIGLKAQEQRITVNVENKTLRDLFSVIEKQSAYRFSYRNVVLDNKKDVTIHKKDASVSEILKTALAGRNLDFNIVSEKSIVISDKRQSQSNQPDSKKISGILTDENGEPIIGANVAVKGTTKGIRTDVDGKFSLDVQNNAVLQVSYIGYKTQEIVVGNQTNLNITLNEDSQVLKAVVVVGYGTQRKQAITGAVSVANLETFKDLPSNNIIDKLKGSIAGLNIGGVNKAGAVGDIVIRGQNTVAGNYPLIVVDGAIFAGGTIADIAPGDIESFTVLKDASSAAVYGSRSANGVILIETKRGRGKEGKPVFNVNLNYGLSNELERLKIYGPEDYLQRILDIREANGIESDPNRIDYYLEPEERKNYEAMPNHLPTMTDPYDVMRQTAYNRNLSVSVANQTDKSRYYLSVNLIDQQGVILNDRYKHISGRMNIDSDITKWLNIGVKAFYSFRDNSGTLPYADAATRFSPWASLYNEDGSYAYAPQSTVSFINPFWNIATEDTKQMNNLNSIFTATIKAPWVEGLTYTTNLSNTIRWENFYQFYGENTVAGAAANGIGGRSELHYNNLLWDNIVKYNRIFKEKHYVDATLLFSQEKYSYESTRANAEDFDNLTLGSYRLQDGKKQTVSTGGGGSEAIGMMARGTYTYDNRYSLTGTIRRDGYSAFSKNRKFGIFPSTGVNWQISNESFMRDISYLNNLALRATYGTNGNQSIGLYQTLAKVGTDKYIYAGSPSYVTTQYISSLPTDDLSWESTTGLNLGLDFGWLNNRISGSVDVYQTNTHDMLFTLQLPKASGIANITSNLGKIQNRGIEVSLNTLPIDHSDFKWNSIITFSLNRNKIVSIYGDDNDGDGKEDDLISSGYFIGKSLGNIYAYKVLGMYQQEDVDNGTIMTGMRPGEYQLEDVDGDGDITSDKDRQHLGNSKENFRWSWTNTFKYKGFSLMVYLYSIWGGKGWYQSGNNTPYFDYFVNNSSINHPVYDYWTPTNTNAMFPRPNYRDASRQGTKYYDRSFIKLQKISLSYDVGKWVRPWGINDLTVAVSADNLLTYAPYWIGLDPEMDQGLRDNAIPSIRTYNFSLVINF